MWLSHETVQRLGLHLTWPNHTRGQLNSRGDLIQAELWLGVSVERGVCLIMGACHGGDVIVWLPATLAPTSCQLHVVQMSHPGDKCQAMSAQQPRQEVVAAQWTLPTVHGKALSKGNGGRPGPKTSATPLPLPLSRSGIEYQVYLRQGPSTQTMNKREQQSQRL